MEFEKVMLSRKSCRSYLDKKVEEEKLEKVITAASMAPLGLPKACRPHLTVVTDPAVLKELGQADGRDMIYGAPVLIVVSCPESRPGIAEMNAACVIEMMAMEATDLGLGNIYLYGVTAALQKNAEMIKKLGIPRENKPLSALALGYSRQGEGICKEFKKSLTENRI